MAARRRAFSLLRRCSEQLRTITKSGHAPEGTENLDDRQRRIYKEIAASGLFDNRWYLSQYPDVAMQAIDPLLHYLHVGAARGYDPNPQFQTDWYLKQYADVAGANVNPLFHYIRYGAKEGRLTKQITLPEQRSDPTVSDRTNKAYSSDSKMISVSGDRPSELTVPIWFLPAWYQEQEPAAPEHKEGAYRHFCEIGAALGRTPHPLFQLPDSYGKVPAEYRRRISMSPILCRAPATLYLSHFSLKKELHRSYGTLSDYMRASMTNPNLINARLWENDLRVAAFMDSNLRRLASSYVGRSQDELISVIMPTYNRPAEIVDAILSVVSQSYRNWELIVVDDASDQPSVADVVASFADKRIRYVHLDKQVGNGEARNIGIANASGSVIAYLDDDDQWDPDNLLVLLWQMRDAGARCCYAAQAVWLGFDPTTWAGKKFKAIRFAPFNRSLLENANYISMIGFIHERSLVEEVGGLDSSLSRFLDWDLFLRITEVAPPIAVPAILSHYYQERAASSVSSPVDKSAPLQAIRSRLESRSDVHLCYRTDTGAEHIAFSLGEKARAARRGRLASLPLRKVRIVIPNYEAVEELGACLDSIASYTDVSHDILVVDNNSAPESLTRIQTVVAKFANVQLVTEPCAGFSHAVNRGLRELRDCNDLILILNNDTVVTPDWLEELQFVLHKHDSAAVAVPRQVLPAGSEIIKHHVPGAMDNYECDINLSAHHGNVLDPEFDVTDSLVELSYAPLFCALVRPEVIRVLGGLDARNGAHYRSDWVFSDEVRRLTGGRVIYTPHSKIYHMQGTSTRIWTSNQQGSPLVSSANFAK